MFRILYKPKRLELAFSGSWRDWYGHCAVAGRVFYNSAGRSGLLQWAGRLLYGERENRDQLMRFTSLPSTRSSRTINPITHWHRWHCRRTIRRQPLFSFSRRLLKQPNPQDYAGLSQTYLQTNLFFEAVKALQRGIQAFPKSGELKNNLGYLYARTSVADSAYYYLNSATTHGKSARDSTS